jgi:hypothetical protein
MPCKHYKNALAEAAASGAEPQGDLRAHLAGCADCRIAFEREQALFSSIDAGVHVTANAEVPVSLLPRVRAELDKTVEAQRPWFRPWIFAAASITIALAIFQFARPRHSGSDNRAKLTPQIEVPTTNPSHQNAGPATQIVSSNMNGSQARVHRTLLRRVTSSQPEVLVPPDERVALALLVARLQERGDVAVALVTPVPQTEDASVGVKPLQIKGLEIKTLEERQTEVSVGAEQKQ